MENKHKLIESARWASQKAKIQELRLTNKLCTSLWKLVPDCDAGHFSVEQAKEEEQLSTKISK